MGIWAEVVVPKRLRIQELSGTTIAVVATYRGTGLRRRGNRLYATVVVTDVRDAVTGSSLADHLWFNRGETWRRAEVTRGDQITFEARAIEYRTGYWGANKVRRADTPPRVEYKLTPPKRIAVVRGRSEWRAAA